MNTVRPAHRWLVAALRVALVLALAGAGWLIYRRLPHDDSGSLGASSQARETMLRIILPRTGADSAANYAAPIQLYSIDVAAAQREFFDERRPGLRFEDFIVRRMGARQPIRAQPDANGQTIVSVPPGRWWIHAALAGNEEISWRLPVNVAGREQTIELNHANSCTSTKRF